MNRKERRAAAKRGRVLATAAPMGGGPESRTVAELMAEARRHHQQGRSAQAQDICHRLLAREPSHVDALNLFGVIAQESGRHTLAVKVFAKAIAADELDAGSHYNIAISYQALDRREEAAVHFRRAIALGMTDKDVHELIAEKPIVAACLARLARKWPLPIRTEELFGAGGVEAVANDVFLQSAMVSITICGREFEAFLTHLRSALLRLAETNAREPRLVSDYVVDCFCALAQQCFINEYVFAQSDEETRLAIEWRDRLSAQIAAGGEVPPLMLAAVAAYFPLQSLAMAESLLHRDWPQTVAGLLRQQIGEPLEEARDRSAIPALTSVDDRVSLQVMRQYEENPYPRWTLNPLTLLAGERKTPSEPAGSGKQRVAKEILIAGCGTGQHAFQISRSFPEAHVLAVDISLASLAYARRKTREEGLRNIEYAQADILKLATIGRSFDRIEAIGVLHHLAEPKAGWRVLLTLLRPDGEMRIGLYSEIARRAVVEARALIAERAYRATAEDIRKCRQELLRGDYARRWKDLTAATDFYSMSECRDLLFNVMEHRFTIAEIKAFLDEQGLTFLGFELEGSVIEKFQQQFGAAALTDLDRWHSFEAAHPQTFRTMYVFSVRKAQRA